MTDDTERKEAKCLGHRVLPSSYTFVPNGFMSPPDGWVSSGKPCEDMPQWLKDAKMAIDKEEGKRLGDIGLKSTVGDGKPGLKSTVGSECPQSDGLRVTVTEPYKVYYSPPLVMQWAEKQDPSNWEVKTNEDRLGEPVGPITMEETLIRAGKGIMERLIFEEKRNWHKREKNMIGMGKQSKKPRRLTGWEISTKRSPVVKPPDDTERKEAKCLGHRVLPSSHKFNPNGFIGDNFSVKITSQADCVHEPIKRVTLPHITRPPNAVKNPTGKHITDHAQDIINSVNAMAFEAGALTGRNTILEERNAMLLEALKALDSATTGTVISNKVWCAAKEKAKRAIEICEGERGIDTTAPSS
jgi:hypothetical protein